MKSIPTQYKGTNFRSRLEARWAAYFDMQDWGWTYEPIDLGGWTPDFSIHTKHGDVLVEVKPVAPRATPENFSLLPPDRSFDKARKHQTDNWILLLGTRPQKDADHWGIGTLMDPPGGSTPTWLEMLGEVCPSVKTDKWNVAANRVQWRAI